MEDAAVGIGHRRRPAVIRAVGHFRVGVLNLGRRTRVHPTAVNLILGYELPQAMVRPLDLVHDVAAGGSVVTGEQVRQPRAVVRRLDPADAVVHAGACDSDCVASRPGIILGVA